MSEDLGPNHRSLFCLQWKKVSSRSPRGWVWRRLWVIADSGPEAMAKADIWLTQFEGQFPGSVKEKPRRAGRCLVDQILIE